MWHESFDPSLYSGAGMNVDLCELCFDRRPVYEHFSNADGAVFCL